MPERPLAALDIVFVGHHELEQMAYRGRQHVAVALVIVAFAREAAKRARDVGRDRRFLCNDEFLAHAARKAADDKCKAARDSTAGAHARVRARRELSSASGFAAR